jgi:hypothetical protein
MVAAIFALLAVQDTYAPDAEGFIRNWLILAPIPLESENNGATEINAQQVKDEAKLAPKAGDKATANKKDLAWTAHKTAAYFIDFRDAFGKDLNENVAGYAVAYVQADAELDGLKLQVGSNDQCKAYLNGTQVLVFEETRTLEKDQNAANVTLKKGRNTVILKVVNEGNNWQGCLRFTGKDGAPVKNLKVTLSPE